MVRFHADHGQLVSSSRGKNPLRIPREVILHEFFLSVVKVGLEHIITYSNVCTKM